MSACFPGAFPARSVGLSICGLTIVIICLTLQQPVAAKNSILFDYHKDAIATRSDGDLVALRRSEVKEEIMHNCTKITEGSHIKVVCGHETFYEAEPKDSPGSFTFFRDVVLCVFFVIMSGTMSGLTLGLLGMDVNTLDILKRQGTPQEKIYATRLLPLVKNHHWLLVTLLLINAGCMEALPIFLNHLMPDYLAIIVSVTAVLFFGEIIPQAILSRWALQIGGSLWWLVQGLMYLTFPLSYPIAKLLDILLGHKSGLYYKRAQLKEFVSSHAASAFQNGDGSNGGGDGLKLDDDDGSSSASSDGDDGGLPKEERLTNDEVMIIKGALDLTSKNVTHSMTPLDKVFSLDERTVIDPQTLQSILDAGHSRIPLWRDDPSNFVGMLLVKSLNLNFILEGGILARADIKELPLVDDTTPLYTMLNIFQTGRSHMAAVLAPGSTNQSIGIITLEDIIEELIQEEIEDEMDIWRREHIRVRKTPSRRSSFEISKSSHALHHHRSNSNSSLSVPGASSDHERRESRRDQRRRTRRGREMALRVDSDTDTAGVESDFGPSTSSRLNPSSSSPLGSANPSPGYMSSSPAVSSHKTKLIGSSNPSPNHSPSSQSSQTAPKPLFPSEDTEMVQLDI